MSASWPRSGLVSALFCATLCWSTSAFATDPSVVIVTSPSEDEAQARLVRRLRAELAAAGFRLVTREHPASKDDPRAWLPKLTEEAEAPAGVLISSSDPPRVLVWVGEESGHAATWTVVEHPGDGEELALRVIEHVESSLFELLEQARQEEEDLVEAAEPSPGPEPEPDPNPEPDDEEVDSPPPPAESEEEAAAAEVGPISRSLGLDLGMLAPAGAFSVTGAARFSFRQYLLAGRNLHVGANLGSTLPPMRLPFEGGTTNLSLIDLNATVGASLRSDTRWRPRAELAIGPTFALASESVNGGRAATVVGSSGLGLGVGFALNPQLQLNLDLRGVTWWPRLRVADPQGAEESTMWGLSLTLGVAATWRKRL